MKKLLTALCSAVVLASVAMPPAAAKAEAAGDNKLHGTWGTTDIHYVQKNEIEFEGKKNYRRITYDDVRAEEPVTELAMTAWKGDYVNACLVLWTENAAKDMVSVTAGDFVSRDSLATIPAGNVTVSFQKRIVASMGHNQGDTPYEEIADVLYTSELVYLDESFLQPVWIQVQVPYTTPSGTYDAAVTATDKEGEKLNFTYTLEVLNIAYPVEETEFDLNLMAAGCPTEVWDSLGLPMDLYWSDYAIGLLEPYLDFYLGREEVNGMYTDMHIYENHDPVTCAPIKYTRKADGTWTFDFSGFNRFMKFLYRYEKLEIMSLMTYASSSKYYDEATGKEGRFYCYWDSPLYVEMFPQFLRAVKANVEAEGFTDRFRFCLHIDEQPEESMWQWVNTIKETTGDFFLLDAATNNNNISNAALYDNFWYVEIVLQESWEGEFNLVKDIEHRTNLGLKTTVYTCVGNFPNSFSRSNPAESAWISWYCLKIGASGFARWNYFYFSEDSLFSTDHMYFDSGDCNFVYLGAKSSVRYEKLAEGVMDANKALFLMDKNAAIKTSLEKALEEMPYVSDNGGWGSFDEYGSRYDRQLVDYAESTAKLKAVLLENARKYAAMYGEKEEIVPVEHKKAYVGDVLLATDLVNVPKSVSVSSIAFKTKPDTSTAGIKTAVVTVDGKEYTVALEVTEKPRYKRSVDIYDLDEYLGRKEAFNNRLGLKVEKVEIGAKLPTPPNQEEEKPEKKGCGSAVNASSLAVAGTALTAAAFAVIGKKRKI